MGRRKFGRGFRKGAIAWSAGRMTPACEAISIFEFELPLRRYRQRLRSCHPFD